MQNGPPGVNPEALAFMQAPFGFNGSAPDPGTYREKC